MCIICVKQKGVAAPSKTAIENMCNNNPDGFGVMWVKNGKIKQLKTFNEDEFVNFVSKLGVNTPAIIHTRIATHGSVNLNNIHPFLSDDKSIAFAHNGILSIRNEGDMTDSETFFRRIAIPLLKTFDINSDSFEKAVECVIGTSKFAFMKNDGYIKTFGNFIEDKGLLYSNTTYSYSYPYKSFFSKGIKSSNHYGHNDLYPYDDYDYPETNYNTNPSKVGDYIGDSDIFIDDEVRPKNCSNEFITEYYDFYDVCKSWIECVSDGPKEWEFEKIWENLKDYYLYLDKTNARDAYNEVLIDINI